MIKGDNLHNATGEQKNGMRETQEDSFMMQVPSLWERQCRMPP